MDVEIEEDEEEPTLRPAPETSDSPPKNGSQFFENSDDDDDEDEDVLGRLMCTRKEAIEGEEGPNHLHPPHTAQHRVPIRPCWFS